MSDFVVDASVAMKWFVAEADASIADEISASRHRLFAPYVIFTEVANALTRKTIAGLMSISEARDNFRLLRFYLDGVLEIDELIEPAMKKAALLRHPIYDLIYLEAAGRLEAQLVTADFRFVAKLTGTEFADHVVLLSDWRPE